MEIKISQEQMKKKIQEQLTKLNYINKELKLKNTMYRIKTNRKLIKIKKFEEEIKILKDFEKNSQH